MSKGKHCKTRLERIASHAQTRARFLIWLESVPEIPERLAFEELVSDLVTRRPMQLRLRQHRTREALL